MLSRTTTTWLGFARRLVTWFAGELVELAGFGPDVEPHTRVTFRAVADAVVPETPVLAEELGPEHVPGGLAIGLDEFAITFVDDGFQLGLPHLGPQGNIPLAEPIAHALDLAALSLVEQGDNEAEPRTERALSLLGPDDPAPAEAEDAVGPFAELSRRDRLRAVGILDEFELTFSPTEADLFELDAGLVGQLVIGFVEMIYYSEWQGYDDFIEPPSLRQHPNEPAAVQSWHQTGFPGFANGYAALRGYLGSNEGSLGAGETWTTIDAEADVRIRHESGSFRENEYDTSDYEELFAVNSG
ncbi:MAG: hypothetical protein V5A49_03915 [Haloarcula sp.]